MPVRSVIRYMKVGASGDGSSWTFAPDGTIGMTAHKFAFIDRHPSGGEALYKTADDGFIALEARIKGGIGGAMQSLSYHTIGRIILFY
jgi:hypothetical protein